MSTNERLLTPLQTPHENPRVEFRDGQFLFAMTNQEGGLVERFVSNAAVREAFSGIPIDSGWLRPEVVRWGDGKTGEWAVAFIAPQVHELELAREEAGEAANPAAISIGIDRVLTPLPGLVFFGLGTQYYVWAVKTERLDPYHEVYRCPLPNVEANALICWGSYKPPRATARTLFDAFDLFIKSTFNNHRANGKSKSQREDVRVLLRGLLHETSSMAADRYPVEDLVRQVEHTGVTLDKSIRQFFETGEMPG